MRHSLAALGTPACLVAALLATTADAQTTADRFRAQPVAAYTIIDIGDLAPSGESDGTNATGMNELGHVAAITGDGSGPLGMIPVLYRDGQLINLGGFPGVYTSGGSKGVNNLGQVSGWSMAPYPTGGHQSEPFVWTEGTGMVNPIDDEPVNYSGEAWDVNDAGQMVFTGYGGFDDPVTGLTLITFPSGGGSWKAWDLNEDGVVAGSAFGPAGSINAFRYASATATIENLNDQVIDYNSDGYGINDLGDVAGWAHQWDFDRPAIVWTASGQTLRLPIGGLGPNQNEGSAEHINNHGDIVGLDAFVGASGGDPAFEPIGWVAFDALDGTPIVKTNLLELLDPAQAADWRRLHPFEINDRGEICGIAVAGAGGARGFLMVPNTPERFRNLSRALAGTNGHPVLVGKGLLAPGTPVEFELFKARPNAPGFLMLGTGTSYAPFRGGVIVPDIFSAGGVSLPIVTDATGGHLISTTWPAGFPADLEVVIQYWIVDAAGPAGASASNAITQTTR